MESSGYAETTTTTLEWKITGLKKIFDSSRGDVKSKVIKSTRFAGGKWQILFYPNSGTDGGSHVSLYLSCEPTTEEKEKAPNGQWTREGLFKFSFELRNATKTLLFNSKEACDHSFSSKTANWGWAQFAKRDIVYYQANSVKMHDSFCVVCVITSSPAAPVQPTSHSFHSIPRNLLDSVGNLLNDPLYSDVEFVLPSAKAQEGEPADRIYAMKRMLSRMEYFDIMLNSGFAEGAGDHCAGSGDDDHRLYDAEDSDFEDEVENDERIVPTAVDPPITPTVQNEHQSQEYQSARIGEHANDHGTESLLDNTLVHRDQVQDGSPQHEINSESKTSTSRPGSVMSWLSADTSHRTMATAQSERAQTPTVPLDEHISSLGPPKVRIVVKDVAYRTYFSMLHYIYTDTITFAPLSSSFSQNVVQDPTSGNRQTTLRTVPSVSILGASTSRPESQLISSLPKISSAQQSEAAPPCPTSRSEWLDAWRKANPGRVEPCSAKALYRLADKLELLDLKNRAFQHITKSITVHNVAHEVFSSFSAQFDEVRKVEVEFFLKHWSTIRGSDAMKDIWQQIRVGRHPGFEEVWPLIAMNLEFKPGAISDEKEEAPAAVF